MFNIWCFNKFNNKFVLPDLFSANVFTKQTKSFWMGIKQFEKKFKTEITYCLVFTNNTKIIWWAKSKINWWLMCTLCEVTPFFYFFLKRFSNWFISSIKFNMQRFQDKWTTLKFIRSSRIDNFSITFITKTTVIVVRYFHLIFRLITALFQPFIDKFRSLIWITFPFKKVWELSNNRKQFISFNNQISSFVDLNVVSHKNQY